MQVMELIKKRKRRSDRRHLIYLITNVVTGERYVGLAVCVDRSGKETLRWRWHRHVQRARDHGKAWKLCEAIRTYGPDAFVPEPLEFVRGKAAAHLRETQLKRELRAELNTL
jgi:hypothetical protein